MATSKKDNRPIGYAISKLFKNAYATYRENMYKVETIEKGEPILLDWITYHRMKQRLRLLDPETFTGLALPSFQEPKTDQEKLKYALEFIKKVQISEMQKAIARLTPELESFMCDNCNNFLRGISFVKGVNHFKFLCPKCGQHLSQAPLLIRSRKIKEDRRNTPIVTYLRANKKKCPSCGIEDWLGLVITDPEQPMGSLKWICKHCNNIVGPLETFKFGYKPQEPTENLTKGITVSLAHVESSTLNPIEVKDFLNKKMCKGIFYSEKVVVSQVTWGYKLGQYENIRYKTYGRQFNTEGLIFELNPEVYQASLEYLKKLYVEDEELYNRFLKDIENTDPEMKEMQLKRWVLHTLKHALLMYLPIITGLPHREFGGSYDLDNNRVIIYDNQEGGIGGCQKLWNDSNTLMDLLDLITGSIEGCDCRSKCPRCILLDTCGEVNQALNRHLLVPLFEDIETFYD